MSGRRIGEIAALAVCVILLVGAWLRMDLGEEPAPPTSDDQVEVVGWNWKQNRAGNILAVFGTVKNNTEQTFDAVVLELRTETEDKTVLGRHSIKVGKLGPNETKPFREDIPRSGEEAMGYVEVKSLKK